MDYATITDALINIHEREIRILKLRKHLYSWCQTAGIADDIARRLCNGTFFGCNTNYRAIDGRGLETEDAIVINGIYDQIDMLQKDIESLQGYRERTKA